MRKRERWARERGAGDEPPELARVRRGEGEIAGEEEEETGGVVNPHHVAIPHTGLLIFFFFFNERVNSLIYLSLNGVKSPNCPSLKMVFHNYNGHKKHQNYITIFQRLKLKTKTLLP